MASPQYYHLVLALLATTLFINPAWTDEATQNLIDHICRQMEEYAFCDNTFNQNLKGRRADMAALTLITIEQAVSHATDTHSFIALLLKKATDPAEKEALTTCEDAYRLVMGGFQEAAAVFFLKDYDSMLLSMRPAPRAQAGCTAIFNTPPNPASPVGDRNRQMRILIAMAIAAGTDLTRPLDL
ncbi:uncharacterized protein LOC110414636 [Herrania umbratica]|uniref:Uncharacterized protein LOC110414636 n=1 Tax=Herrania umbratica TaxID=108875 RepID=A0A6J1A3B4_9ROSI|nr:uncharacterized protein LOC110414636 [Herrania umbratica]